MTIAVDTRFLMDDDPAGYGSYLYESFYHITKDHPEHRFIFLFDRPYEKSSIKGENISQVIAGPAARHPLLWQFWYNIKLPGILKKHNADFFIGTDGICSLSAKTPQCLLVNDLSFLRHPAFFKRSLLLFYKRYTPRFLNKAKRIITASGFSRDIIMTHYKTAGDKIDIVPVVAREMFHALNEKEKSEVKNRLTNGIEYFLYTGPVHPRKNLLNLLKAFSIFKKRQASNWKLVLAGNFAGRNKQFMKSLETYKYREDVILAGDLQENELVNIMSSAYALVYPSLWEGSGLAILEAMHSDVPVIASGGSAMQEIAGDAALYVDPADQTDIAEKMMRLYKDENLRNQLVEKGRNVCRQYNPEQSAALLWQAIVKTVGQ
jgi:glycosyltransferase involved in cell wall biosynthesis